MVAGNQAMKALWYWVYDRFGAVRPGGEAVDSVGLAWRGGLGCGARCG